MCLDLGLFNSSVRGTRALGTKSWDGTVEDDLRISLVPENKVLEEGGTCQKDLGANLRELLMTKAGIT